MNIEQQDWDDSLSDEYDMSFSEDEDLSQKLHPAITLESCSKMPVDPYILIELFDGKWGWYEQMLLSNNGKLRVLCQCGCSATNCDAGSYSTRTREIILSGYQNPTNVILTFLHELAHLKTFDVNPDCQAHGKEWKKEYKTLIKQEMDAKVFPEEHLATIKKILKNPLAQQKYTF